MSLLNPHLCSWHGVAVEGTHNLMKTWKFECHVRRANVLLAHPLIRLRCATQLRFGNAQIPLGRRRELYGSPKITPFCRGASSFRSTRRNDGIVFEEFVHVRPEPELRLSLNRLLFSRQLRLTFPAFLAHFAFYRPNFQFSRRSYSCVMCGRSIKSYS